MSNLSLMYLKKTGRLAAMRFYNPESGSKEGLNVKSVQRVVLIMGRYVEQVLLSGCLSICTACLGYVLLQIWHSLFDFQRQKANYSIHP